MLEVAGGKVTPSGHGKQSKSVVRPVRSLYFPAAQSVQAALPAVALYLPATHAAHGPPSGPVEPAAHSGVTQSSSVSLPAGEDLMMDDELTKLETEIAEELYVLAEQPVGCVVQYVLRWASRPECL
jgi:hypothetical protein